MTPCSMLRLRRFAGPRRGQIPEPAHLLLGRQPTPSCGCVAKGESTGEVGRCGAMIVLPA
jgi:hypothetical protein